jgi:hypothetical protein
MAELPKRFEGQHAPISSGKPPPETCQLVGPCPVRAMSASAFRPEAIATPAFGPALSLLPRCGSAA